MQTNAPHSASECASPDRYVDGFEAAQILGLSEQYLRQLRLVGGGPIFCRFGRAVRYPLDELHLWARSKAAGSTSDRAAA